MMDAILCVRLQRNDKCDGNRTKETFPRNIAMIKIIKCTTTKTTYTFLLIISSYNFLTLIEYKKHILLQNVHIKIPITEREYTPMSINFP